ncbi:MAG: porin family protein [Rickettsiales bacterium]|nr:porin family protein [Rickettsiales bacterium]
MKKTLLSCVSLALALAPAMADKAKAAPTKTVHRQSDRIVINWDNGKSKMKKPTRVVKEEVRVKTPVTITKKQAREMEVKEIKTVKKSYKEESFVYGKAYGMIGYEAQIYDGAVEKELDAEIAQGTPGVNSYNHSLALTLGYNLYFRASDAIHPFVGIVGEGRLPIHNKIVGMPFNGEGEMPKMSYSEWAYLALKAGLKFNLCDSFALQPYGLFGGNIATLKENDSGDVTKSRRFGMTMGAGIEAILNDHVMIGGEWRYSTLAKFHGNTMKHHTFAAKLGFMF